jgi:hypothetical protein
VYTLQLPVINEVDASLLQVDTTSYVEVDGAGPTNSVSIFQKLGFTTIYGGASLGTSDGYTQYGGELDSHVADISQIGGGPAGSGAATATFTGDVKIHGGEVLISTGGDSPVTGTLQINGNMTIDGGVLTLGIISGTTDQYDVLSVSGTLTLGGTSELNIDTLGGGAPAASGTTYKIITANSISGDFSSFYLFYDESGDAYTPGITTGTPATYYVKI